MAISDEMARWRPISVPARSGSGAGSEIGHPETGAPVAASMA